MLIKRENHIKYKYGGALKVNKRQEKIVLLLNDTKAWMTGKEISKLMQVSDRTIRSDIDAINRYYEQPIIESNLRSGYHIRDEINVTLPTAQKFIIPQTPQERCVYIIRVLLFEKKELNLMDLQDQVFISGYSIDNDIKRIKKILENYNDLKLIRSKNHIHLEGSEDEMRKLYKDLLTEETQGNFLNLNKLSSMFKGFDLLKVKDIMENILKEYNYRIREMAIPMLMIHIGVAIERMLHHNYIKTSRGTDLENTKEYQIAKEFFNRVSKIVRIDINENEVELLALLLMGKNSMNLQNDLVSAYSKHGYNVNELVSQIIESIKSDYDIDFSKDVDLRSGIALHLQGLVERKNKNIHIDNMYLQELKKKYPLVFELSIRVGEILNEELGIDISENEQGFLALHLGAAYERTHNHQHYKAIMIYPVDQAFGDILLKKVDFLFNERMDVIQSVSYFEEKTIKELDPDLILTTSPLQHNLDIPTVQISVFITTEDESRIFQTLNALDKKRFQNEFKAQIIDLIEPETFHLNLKTETPEETIEYMCDHLKKLGYSDDAFKKSVLQREKMASTSFVYSFAVPHSLNVASFRSSISVAFLEKPIKWGEFEVKMVMLLAINEVYKDTLVMFFDWLSSMINNANHFVALLESQSYEEFISKIIE